MSSSFQRPLSILMTIYLVFSPFGAINFLPDTSWNQSEVEHSTSTPNVEVTIFEQFTHIINSGANSKEDTEPQINFPSINEFRGFIENQGQYNDPKVKYYMNSNEITIGFTDHGPIKKTNVLDVKFSVDFFG